MRLSNISRQPKQILGAEQLWQQQQVGKGDGVTRPFPGSLILHSLCTYLLGLESVRVVCDSAVGGEPDQPVSADLVLCTWSLSFQGGVNGILPCFLGSTVGRINCKSREILGSEDVFTGSLKV